MPNSLTDLPEWSSALRLVVDSLARSFEIPGREQLRTGAMLRAHARGVLRRLARSCAAVHEIDRCSELEHAEAHCARIDYLCTLIASLKWQPRLEMELLRSRWLSLRGRLARASEQLVGNMTWRSGDRPEPIVVPAITRSLPALLPAARAERRAEAAFEIASLVEVPPRDTVRVGPPQFAPIDGTELDSWVDELGSWFEVEPCDDAHFEPCDADAHLGPVEREDEPAPHAPRSGRSTVRLRPPPAAPSTPDTISQSLHQEKSR